MESKNRVIFVACDLRKWGIPILLLLSYMMYASFDMALYTFDPDWFMYGITVVAVIGILGFSMVLSINKIKGDNIIEVLKEDEV